MNMFIIILTKYYNHKNVTIKVQLKVLVEILAVKETLTLF